MENVTTDCAAFDEAVVFLSYFKDLEDPRQQGKGNCSPWPTAPASGDRLGPAMTDLGSHVR